MKEFCKKVCKKIRLGKSDVWLTRHLPHRPRELAYYIADWRISCDKFHRCILVHYIWFFLNIWFIPFCSRINLGSSISWDFFYFSSKWIDLSKNGWKCVVKIWKRYYIDKRFCGNSDQKLFPNAPKNVRSWETFTIKRGSKLYISNTLNTDYLLWHSKVQFNIKSQLKSWVIIFTFQVFWGEK